VHTLHGVGTVQRFVEHEHVGIAHERGGDLRALPHALAEPVDAPVGDVEHRHGPQRVVGRAPVADAVEVGDVANELARGEPVRHRLVLRHECDPAEHTAIATRVAAVDAYGALIDVDESAHRAHERRLACPVGPEETGDTRPERATQFRERDFLTEPDRHVVDGDRRVVRECRVVRGGRFGAEGFHHRSTHR
jgi:hypothetical protein